MAPTSPPAEHPVGAADAAATGSSGAPDATSAATVEPSVGGALRWSLGNNVLSRLGTFVSGIVLARLLLPADYGEFVVALTVLVLVVNANDLGMEAALVRHRGRLVDLAPTATTLIFLSSCALAGVVIALAPWLATALGDSGATGIVRVLGASVVINGATAVPSAQLTRDFRQDRRLVADLAGFFTGTGLTIALAWTGHGAWSLAWGRVAGNATTSALHVVFAGTWYRPSWSRAAARELWHIGPPIAGTAVLAVLMLNVDYIVVGHVLGTVALGYYLMAFNLSSWPVNMFSTAVESVAIPGFARLQHDEAALRSTFLRWFALLVAVAVPAVVVLALCAAPLIRLLYGERWTPAAAALSFLAVLGLLRVAFHFFADLLIATGRGRVSFRLQALWLVVLVPALTLGAINAGIAGVSAAHVLVALIVMTPAFVRALRFLRVRARDLARVVRRPAMAGVGAAILATIAVHLLPDANPLGVAIQLGAAATLVGATYAAIVGPGWRGLGRLDPLVVDRLAVVEPPP